MKHTFFRLILIPVAILLMSAIAAKASDDSELMTPVAATLNVATADPCCLVMGDVNNDGEFNPLDAVFNIWYFWKGGWPPACLDAADVNCTGNYDPLDAIYIVNHLWKSGPPPCECSDVPD